MPTLNYYLSPSYWGGSIFDIILALAVRKHRFGADLRTNFLEELGHERNVFPIRSEEGLRYLRNHGKRNGTFDNWIRYSSERGLIGFMFAISIVLAGLCGLASYQTAVVIWDLANNGQNFYQIVDKVTNGTYTKTLTFYFG
jgi:hypothetical protein